MKKYFIVLLPITLCPMLRMINMPFRVTTTQSYGLQRSAAQQIFARHYKMTGYNNYERCRCKRVVDCHDHLLKGLEQLKVVRAKMRLGYEPSIINQAWHTMNKMAGCSENQALLNFMAEDDAFLDAENVSLDRMIAVCHPRQIDIEEEQELADEYEEYTGISEH